MNARGSPVVPTLPLLREALVGDQETFKSMNSDVQDVYVSEQDALLSLMSTLASDLRPSPGAALE